MGTEWTKLSPNANDEASQLNTYLFFTNTGVICLAYSQYIYKCFMEHAQYHVEIDLLDANIVKL
jgi:hypothetical protein